MEKKLLKKGKNLLVIEPDSIVKNRKLPVSTEFGKVVAMIYDDFSEHDLEALHESVESREH